EFNWSDVKNDYNHANDKKKFIQDLEMWFKKKPLTVAKEKGKSTHIDSLIKWFRSEDDDKNENNNDNSDTNIEL
ncbi:9395_t:CDS:2, partial [Racocetra fulgida]